MCGVWCAVCWKSCVECRVLFCVMFVVLLYVVSCLLVVGCWLLFDGSCVLLLYDLRCVPVFVAWDFCVVCRLLIVQKCVFLFLVSLFVVCFVVFCRLLIVVCSSMILLFVVC